MLKTKFIKLLFLKMILVGGVSVSDAAPQINLSEIKDEISKYENNVTQIKASLRSLDSKIDKENQVYLKRLERERKLEGKIEELDNGLEKNKKLIVRMLNQIKKKYISVALSYDEKGIKSKLKEKLLLKNLSEEGRSLESLLIQNKKISQMSNSLSRELSGLKREKGELYSILNDLENKKTAIKDDYFKSLKKKKNLESELTRRKLEKIAAEAYNKGLILTAPLEAYVKKEQTQQGVNFYFLEDSPILSVATGKVVYAGKLSSFGTVVMLKHNDEMRSVILGPYQSKVKRGDHLTKGEIIGYSISKEVEKHQRKIYVELRKNEKPLQTAKYMESTLQI